MALRILIVDDHAEFRVLLRHHILLRWPSAQIDEHDPLLAGALPAGFSGAGLDLVLLDYQLGIEQDGFEHLRRFRAVPAFPPVIMLTATGNEELAVRAIKGGAADYIPKQQMSHQRLASAIQGALDSRAAAQFEPAHPLSGAAPPADLSIPGYQLDRLLAEGGAGTIYLARALSSNRPVVVKVMAQKLPTGEASREAQRLNREYELIGKVDSPCVVKLHELGVSAGHVYMVMEYFAQGSLRERLTGPIPRSQALEYLRQLASALEIIHRAGILHRDLKPANLMLRADDSLALIDFGTARWVGRDLTLTEPGQVIGTPHYMSPEQCSGLELAPASDLYAAGIILYEMLTGELPYTAATPIAVLYKHSYAPLPQLPAEFADLQPLLDALLAKKPEGRFARARDLLRHLKAG